MTKIENRGWAGLFVETDGKEVQIEDVSLLERVDGLVVSDEEISIFLQDGDANEQALFTAGVRGGIARIVFDAGAKSLYCNIEYESPRHLSETEHATLASFSSSQLVDGFGSNPIDTSVVGEGYFLHLGDE
jgi:hypothetical protein